MPDKGLLFIVSLIAIIVAIVLSITSILPRVPSRLPQTVNIIATDFRFEAPASIPAGITTFQLVSQGQEPHHALLLRVSEGHTLEEVVAALQQGGPLPSWLTEAGGPNAVSMGGRATATLDLAPGRYALVCVIPSADGLPHFAKGMIRFLEVTPSYGSAAAEPRADISMRMTDYAFTLSHPITAGRHTIRVENAGPQAHEVVFVQFLPGKTLQDFMAWAEGGEQGPPPVRFLGGLAPIANGGHGWVTMDFTPGEYAMICFIPDANDGKPHLAHGMVQTFTVE